MNRSDFSPTLPFSPQTELQERTKELRFLHQATHLLNLRGKPIDILTAVIQRLPDAWRFPDIAAARITYQALDVTTPGYQPSPWSMNVEFALDVHAPCRGCVEVCYRTAPPVGDGASFLNEEYELLASCAELLKAYFERIEGEGLREKLIQSEGAEQAARAAGCFKDELLGNVAHDLRSSLHVMLGWVQVLGQRANGDEVSLRAFSVLQRNIKLQTKLIEDLLDQARIASGDLHLELRELDLEQLVVYTIDAAHPTAHARRLRLVADLQRVGWVRADEERMQQVLSNLLDNAIKFTPEGGTITVTLRELGSHAALTVEDTGEGIAAELLPHVFQRFRRSGSGPRSGPRSGLGLGLAISKDLIERQNGTITAESAGQGRGARLRILLPLSRPGDVERPEHSTPDQVPGSALTSLASSCSST